VLDLAHDKSTRIDARYSEFDIQGTLVWVYFWVGQVTVKVKVAMRWYVNGPLSVNTDHSPKYVDLI